MAGRRTAQNPEPDASVALLAVGGYGRRELNPFSDIDIVFIHPDAPPSAVAPLEEAIVEILTALSELGIELGSQSTFSLSEAVQTANADMRTKTSLLQSRLLAGNAGCYDRLRERFLAGCIRGQANEYVAWRVEDQERRHRRYGLTVSMQEPNIKNGCGGLRDYQNLIWVSYFRTGGLAVADLVARQLLSPREARQLNAAYDFLMRVRNDLHYLRKSKALSDVLTLEFQPVVAEHLAYPQRTELRRTEAFMRDYYLHARTIYHLSETLAEHFAMKPPSRFGAVPVVQWFLGGRNPRPPSDGFQVREQALHPETLTVFDEDPLRLLRVFRQAQDGPLNLSAALRRLVRAKLPLVRAAFFEPKAATALLEAILSQRGAVGWALRRMHEVDLLGRCLPEFKALTCLPQHDFAHRYTADEHTLVCLEQLDALAVATEPKLQPYRRLLEGLRDPFVLHLALLLHDTGKATGARPATEASALFAQQVSRRWQLTAARRRTLIFLVDHQHTLLQTAQNRNLDDPQTAAAFAGIVGSQEQLDALLLFAWADALGTDERSWTDWKESLVWQLYDETARHLAGKGGTERPRCDRGELARRLLAQLPPDFAEEVEAHVSGMSDRYVNAFGDAEVLGHLRLFREFFERRAATDDRALAPCFRTIPHPEQGHWEVLVAGWDRRDFLTQIAGSFAAARLNILAASVHARADNLALVVLRATGAEGRLPRHARGVEEAEALLARALGAEGFDLGPLLKPAGGLNLLRRQTAGDFPTHIRISNDAHPDFTLVEIQTPDRVGLLHDLLRALDHHGLRIQLSRISTDKGAAHDSFFVTDADHHRILGRQRIHEVQHALGRAIGQESP